MSRLTDKRIWITGASGGLGERLAYLCAAEGAHVFLSARREDRLQEVKKTIIGRGGRCDVFPFDVSNIEEAEDVRRLIGPVDVLINNAGFGIFETAADSSLEDMKAMFEVNVYGLIACTKACLPVMLHANSGHIINIASQAGKLATPKSSLYSATKHAVLGYSNALRMELAGTGISVTTVNPGPIQTDFFTIADKEGGYVKSVGRWMLDADSVAERITAAVLTNKREINLPRWMNAGTKLYQLFPSFVEKLAGRVLKKK
ncbi:SDR family NAD(P)-dependent oxidoreductase [Bacillus nakamurai]|uniref:SDR family NAD(P)-dependent oxidoreductase n=1 Tax=Bacillus nakamurai TaxID=1793963 RepID=UPI0020C53F49|nr:SDR family oxidoreductase [Bacillus nakamurai]MCP6681157.1 SDR family oxidoreductase [Bacillus nakamurai]